MHGCPEVGNLWQLPLSLEFENDDAICCFTQALQVRHGVTVMFIREYKFVFAAAYKYSFKHSRRLMSRQYR